MWGVLVYDIGLVGGLGWKMMKMVVIVMLVLVVGGVGMFERLNGV